MKYAEKNFFIASVFLGFAGLVLMLAVNDNGLDCCSRIFFKNFVYGFGNVRFCESDAKI